MTGKPLVWILIIAIMATIFIFWLRNLNLLFFQSSSVKEEPLFSLFKEGYDETRDIFRELGKRLEGTQIASVSSTSSVSSSEEA